MAKSTVASDKKLRVLLDSSLRFVEISTPTLERMGKPRSCFINEHFTKYPVPSLPSLEPMFRNALKTGLSTPTFELASDLTGVLRIYRTHASPIRPSGEQSDFLDVTFEEHLGGGANCGFSERPLAVELNETPTTSFLLQTLVHKRTVHQRKDATYISIRSWRNSIREYQINALKSLKKGLECSFVRAVAHEISTEVDMLMGCKAFKTVVPISCGHSAHRECLSTELARAVAAEMGIPMVQASRQFRSEDLRILKRI